MTTAGETVMHVPPLKPGRTIEGISAVLLPFTINDQPDWTSFQGLLERTWAAGITPAVNMDTGYVHLLTDDERARVLAVTQDVAKGRRFVDAPEVARITQRRVMLTIDAEEAHNLPEHRGFRGVLETHAKRTGQRWKRRLSR